MLEEAEAEVVVVAAAALGNIIVVVVNVLSDHEKEMSLAVENFDTQEQVVVMMTTWSLCPALTEDIRLRFLNKMKVLCLCIEADVYLLEEVAVEVDLIVQAKNNHYKYYHQYNKFISIHYGVTKID